MATNLIITESPYAACAIALAFDGIIADNEDPVIITYKQSNDNADIIKKLLSRKYIKTKKNNNDYIILWGNNLFVQKEIDFKQGYVSTGVLPFIPPKIEYILNENFAEMLNKIVIQKNIKDVYIAYSFHSKNILNAAALANFLQRETIANIICLEIVAYQKKYIIEAFDMPISDIYLKSLYNKLCRKELINWSLKENLSFSFNIKNRLPFEISPYHLPTLSLLSKRAKQIGQNLTQIIASVNMGDCKVVAISSQKYTDKEKIKFLNDKNVKATFEKPLISSLMTTTDLFEYSGIANISAIAEIAESLFYKGYITNPYTTSTTFPSTFSEDDIKRLLKVCSEISGETLDEECFGAVKKTISKDIEQREFPIIPLRYDTEALSPEEFALYNYIATENISKIKSNIKIHYYLTINNSSFICELPLNKVKGLKRGTKTFDAYLSEGEISVCPHYTPAELVSAWSEREIGHLYEYFNAIEVLDKSVFQKTDKALLTLNENAIKFHQALPSTELKSFDIFTKWSKSAENDSPAKEALMRQDLEFTLHKWIDMILNMDDNEETFEGNEIETTEPLTSSESKPNISVEENNTLPLAEKETDESSSFDTTDSNAFQNRTSTSEYHEKLETICPACGNPYLSKDSKHYFCDKCNFSLPFFFKYKDLSFDITDDDVTQLCSKRSTGIRISSDQDGSSIAGILILDEDNIINFTNKSKKTCPYCHSLLEIYSWGFGCENCNFAVPFIIYGKRIDPANLKLLLNGQRTSLISDLTTKDGQTFTASMKIDKDGRLKLYNE